MKTTTLTAPSDVHWVFTVKAFYLAQHYGITIGAIFGGNKHKGRIASRAREDLILWAHDRVRWCGSHRRPTDRLYCLEQHLPPPDQRTANWRPMSLPQIGGLINLDHSAVQFAMGRRARRLAQEERELGERVP